VPVSNPRSIQRVANAVWHSHFKGRADIRGRVVPTFERLSAMADRLATQVTRISADVLCFRILFRVCF
jgi:hypothetical protein